MRKSGITIIISSVLWALVSLWAGQVYATGFSGADITLTWSGDPMTTQTVSWKGTTLAGNNSVQYQVAGATGKPEEKAAVYEKMPQARGGDAEDKNFFTVNLTGLMPGTKYVYAVVTDGVAGKPHTFATEAKAAVEYEFLVFGDSQSGNPVSLDYKPWQETVHQAYNQNPGAKFFVNMGDLVETGQSYAHWEKWFAAAEGVIDAIPAMPVLGNHETYSPNPLQRDPKPVYFVSQFRLPENGPEKLRGQVYSYDYGQAHLVVLDSQEHEEAVKYGDILNMQSQWLERDLAATRQIWKIVFFHKPPYNNRKGRPNPDVKAAFCPVFDKYHVDVVFNGHEHGIYRTYPIKGDKIQKETKEGTVYYTTGRSGAKYYNDLGPTEWDAFAYNPQDQPCYEAVQVSAAQLVITARKQDGALIDKYTVTK